MTNFRALCAELLNGLDEQQHPDYPWPGYTLAAMDRARAVLAAEPEGEGTPAVTTSALLHPAYEPGDGSADGAQMVEMAWWHPQFGCDSLQMVVDNARAVLARWGRPAAPPAEGEVVQKERPDFIAGYRAGLHDGRLEADLRARQKTATAFSRLCTDVQ